MNAPRPAWYAFGPFRLEVATRALYRENAFVPLAPKAAETLLHLVAAGGLVVTKEQLLEQVWPGVVVEEGGIANNVSALRKVLKADFGEDGGIATVSRRGYRFTEDVRALSSPDATAAPAGAPAAPASEPQRRQPILVADIDNKTGDPVFDGALRQALALTLAQSPLLEVLSQAKVHAALGVMGRTGSPVLGDVALEVCQRTDTPAAITGTIFALGEDYVIGLYAIRASDGDTLVSEQARAKGKNEVLAALDQAALGLRGKLGESLASLKQHASGLAEVATASLDALKAYSTGRDVWDQRGESASLPYMLRAIELDPNLLSAYSAAALMYNNLGQPGPAAEYCTRAYELRDRANDPERYRITAAYHEIVTGDMIQALEAYRMCEVFNPRNGSAANNCGNLYMQLGEFDRAEIELRRALKIEPTGGIISTLVNILLGRGLADEARAMNEEGMRLGYNAYYQHSDAYHLAFLRGDKAAMDRHARAVAGRDGEEDYLIEAQANTEAFHGRYARARELTARAAASALRAGAPDTAALWKAEGALREALAGRHGPALDGAADALATSTSTLVQALCGVTLGLAGESVRAEETALAMDRAQPQATLVQLYWLPVLRGAIALGRKDAATAIDALDRALACDFAMPYPLAASPMLPPYLRGLAYLEAGQWAEAAREFAKITARPSVARNYVVYPLAFVGQARALEKMEQVADAAASRERARGFFEGADRELAALHSL